MGEVSGNTLVCTYHGMAYDSQGLSVNIPCQDMIPPNARARSYPVAERDGAVWIWMGQAAHADPAKIPAYRFHTDPGWAYKTSYTHVHGNYQLLHDNLIDLSHAGWVH